METFRTRRHPAPMGRYYFHLFNDLDVADLEGRELPDDAAAHRVAIIEAREMIAESVRRGRLNLSHRIDVENRFGQPVCSVRFGEAIELIP
jgi:hypothetical protein